MQVKVNHGNGCTSFFEEVHITYVGEGGYFRLTFRDGRNKLIAASRWTEVDTEFDDVDRAELELAKRQAAGQNKGGLDG